MPTSSRPRSRRRSAAGVSVTFDVYPRHSAALADPANAARFAAWLANLAQTYPEVREYVVMNECNRASSSTRSTPRGQNVSAALCGAFLAAGYDALKAVDPAIFVWGLGLSPRGNAGAEGRVEPARDEPGRLARSSSASGTARAGARRR